ARGEGPVDDPGDTRPQETGGRAGREVARAEARRASRKGRQGPATLGHFSLPLDRNALRAPAAPQRRPGIAVLQRSAAPGARSPAQALHSRLGSHATEALVARSIATRTAAGTASL